MFKDDEGNESYEVECPQCEAQQDEAIAFLGQLGALTHYRCRYCGWTWHEGPPAPSDYQERMAERRQMGLEG